MGGSVNGWVGNIAASQPLPTTDSFQAEVFVLPQLGDGLAGEWPLDLAGLDCRVSRNFYTCMHEQWQRRKVNGHATLKGNRWPD